MFIVLSNFILCMYILKHNNICLYGISLNILVITLNIYSYSVGNFTNTLSYETNGVVKLIQNGHLKESGNSDDR